MKIEAFKHTGVLPDGTFVNKPGAVKTKGGIVMSMSNGGCDIEKIKEPCEFNWDKWINRITYPSED